MKKPMIFCFIRVSPWLIRFYEHNIAYLRDRLKPLNLGGYGSPLPYSKESIALSIGPLRLCVRSLDVCETTASQHEPCRP